MHPLRRRLAALAVLAASASLVGCSVDATIVVTADDMVSVDITSWHFYGQDLPTLEEMPPGEESWDPCDQFRQVAALTVTKATTDAGVSCHAVGRATLAAMSWSGGGIVHAGDRYLAVTSADNLGGLLSDTTPIGGAPSTVRLTLPGTVVVTDAAASVSADTVTWTAPVAFDARRAFVISTVPAASTSSVGLIALAAVGGVAAGAGVTFAAFRLRRRSDAAAHPGDDDGEADV